MKITAIKSGSKVINDLVDVRDVKKVISIMLEQNEQITLKTETGVEYDITMKEWGIYATPSFGSRLPRFGLRSVLVSDNQSLYLMLVEVGKEALFESDMHSSNLKIKCWLDQWALNNGRL